MVMLSSRNHVNHEIAARRGGDMFQQKSDRNVVIGKWSWALMGLETREKQTRPPKTGNLHQHDDRRRRNEEENWTCVLRKICSLTPYVHHYSLLILIIPINYMNSPVFVVSNTRTNSMNFACVHYKTQLDWSMIKDDEDVQFRDMPNVNVWYRLYTVSWHGLQASSMER